MLRKGPRKSPTLQKPQGWATRHVGNATLSAADGLAGRLDVVDAHVDVYYDLVPV